MHDLIQKIQHKFPGISFTQDHSFHWSAQRKTIYYNAKDENPAWSLLHELGHASLGHSNYISDIVLLRMEAAAWEQACEFGKQFDITINQDHINECLDTYRDWLYKRSICPTCTAHGVQTDSRVYLCINCHTSWAVSKNRFCRTYRKTSKKSLM